MFENAKITTSKFLKIKKDLNDKLTKNSFNRRMPNRLANCAMGCDNEPLLPDIWAIQNAIDEICMLLHEETMK